MAVGPESRVEHERAVFDGAADRTDLVHGPTEGHGAVTADTSISWTQARTSAARARRNDGAERFRTDRKTDQARGSGGSGAGGRTTRRLFDVPGGLSHAAEPKAALCEGPHRKLGHKHRARVMQPRNHSGVVRRHLLLIGFRTPRSEDAGRIEKILRSHKGLPMERPFVAARTDFLIGRGGLLQRQFFGKRDDAEQLGGVLLQARQIHLGELDRAHLFRLDERREVSDRKECQIFEFGRALRFDLGLTRLERGAFLGSTSGSSGWNAVAGSVSSGTGFLRSASNDGRLRFIVGSIMSSCGSVNSRPATLSASSQHFTAIDDLRWLGRTLVLRLRSAG